MTTGSVIHNHMVAPKAIAINESTVFQKVEDQQHLL